MVKDSHSAMFLNISSQQLQGVCRPVGKDTAQQLETALAMAEGASDYLVQVTRIAADNAASEIQAGETLQEIMAGKLEMAPGAGVDTLTQAIQAAEHFPNLQVSLHAIPATHFAASAVNVQDR